MTLRGTKACALVAASLIGANSSPTPVSVLHVRVPLPAGWRQAARIVLVLENVVTPRGLAFKVQVRLTVSGEPDIVVGSFGVPAQEHGAEGVRPPVTLRVDVTRGLRQWGDAHPRSRTVTFALATMDARSTPL